MSRSSRPGNPGTPPARGPVGTPLQRFLELVKTLQFAWFAGHVDVLLMSLLYCLSNRKSERVYQFLYSFLYLGVLSSFGIIIYQSHFNSSPTPINAGDNKSKSASPSSSASSDSNQRPAVKQLPYIKALVQDENAMYCLLALLWLFTPPFALTIPPFFIFSTFHVLTYVKSVLLPVVFQLDEKNKYVVLVTKFLRENHDKSLNWSCTSELLCLVVTLFRAIACRSKSWIVFVVYSAFIKARYEKSANMRSAVRKWEARIDGLIAHPALPSKVKELYAATKMYISRLGNYSLTGELTNSTAKRQ